MDNKYKINYTTDGVVYIVFNDNPIHVSLLSEFVIEAVKEPDGNYVIIDEDKLKECLSGGNDEHNE